MSSLEYPEDTTPVSILQYPLDFGGKRQTTGHKQKQEITVWTEGADRKSFVLSRWCQRRRSLPPAQKEDLAKLLSNLDELWLRASCRLV